MARLAAIPLVVVLASCVSTPSVSTCVPGTSRVCACASGSYGAQSCNASGGYDPCVCGPIDAGRAIDVGTADTAIDSETDAASVPCSATAPCSTGSSCVQGACCEGASVCGTLCCAPDWGCTTDSAGHPFCARVCRSSADCDGFPTSCCSVATIMMEGVVMGIQDHGYCLGASTRCRCWSAADCRTGACGPVPASTISTPTNDIDVCVPNDGRWHHGCNGGQPCIDPMTCCVRAPNGTDVCANTCSGSSPCGTACGTTNPVVMPSASCPASQETCSW